jgi:hypothetical protein
MRLPLTTTNRGVVAIMWPKLSVESIYLDVLSLNFYILATLKFVILHACCENVQFRPKCMFNALLFVFDLWNLSYLYQCANVELCCCVVKIMFNILSVLFNCSMVPISHTNHVLFLDVNDSL